jgi:hypothetical protein
MLLLLNLTACGTAWKVTTPEHAALEQVLISTAADRAAVKLTQDSLGVVNAKLAQQLGKTFIDEKNFGKSGEENANNGVNKHYALHAVRSNLLDAGVALVDDVQQADTIVDVAEGGLSIDTTSNFVGIPQMGLPIPLAGTVNLPEVPFYKKETTRGLAKLAISLRDAHTGKSKGKSLFSLGTSEVKAWTIFLFFDFIENDLKLPKEYRTIQDSLSELPSL